MSEFFLKIVNMSISASFLVLAVLLLRLVLKKAPKWVSVLLWGFVALRLLMPFSIESNFSLIPDQLTNGEIISNVGDVYIGETDTIGIYEGHEQQTGQQPIGSFDAEEGSIKPPKTVENTVYPVLSWIWLTGMALMLMYTVISYASLQRKISTAVPLKKGILQSENVASPFVLGIIKPKIYLPFRMDDQSLEYVIAHEEAHIRRKDHWWKPFGFLLLAIHWFNPLMWIGYILLCRDIELACDEKVISQMDNENRANYTEALVACSINRRSIAACPLAFGEVGVKERVKSVMNYKKPAFWIIVAAAISCIAVAICFLTNPISNTLNHIEGNNFNAVTQENTTVLVSNGETHTYAGAVERKKMQELYNIQISRKEISLSRSEDRDKTNSLYLNLSSQEKQEILTSYAPGIWIHFNADFTQVWVEDGVKPTLSYKVLKPEKARSVYLSISANATDPNHMIPDISGKDNVSNTTHTRTMTIDDVIGLTLKGMDPTWEDFKSFTGRDIGSGLFVVQYNIDDDFYVLVGDEKLTGTPMYATLHCTYNDSTVDIRKGNVKEFIEQYATPEIKDPAPVEMIHGNLKTYYKNADGTWQIYGRAYRYRLEITGRMPNAVVDSTFVYLSNLKSISFARAWRAAGLSSSMEDYFSPEEAVLVEWINEDDSSAPIEGNTDYVIKTDRLNGAIAEAILSHHKREKPDGLLNTESHIVLVNEAVSGTPLAGQTGHVREVTVYVYYLNMRFHVQGDRPEEHDGIYGQAAITFTIDDNGIYTLKHFVKPESSVDSGADYSAELKNKFVAASEDIAENEEKYGKQLLDGCWKNATDYVNNKKAASTAQPGGNPENRIFDSTLSWAGWTGEAPIFTGALNSSELTTNHTMHLPVYKFQSKASLDRFIENHRDTLTMDQSWENMPSFSETAARYTEDFFKENSLVLVYIATDSISYRYRATGFHCDGTSFVLQIEETTGLEAGDSAVAGWFVTVAVANSLIENCSVFDAYMYDPLTE